MKKIIPFILIGTMLSPTAFAAELNVDNVNNASIDNSVIENNVNNNIVDNKESLRIKNALGQSIVGAAIGNNYSSDDIANFLEKDGKQEEAKSIRAMDVDSSTGMTDKWITSMLEKANGQFGGFDTSQFVTFDTDSSNLLNAKYKLTLSNLAENGWGKIPTGGVFENANGFQGYTITADSGASNAAELFGKEYSEILDSMNNGTFMQSLDSLKQDMDVNKAKENVGFNAMQTQGVNLMGSLNNMDAMSNMINVFGQESNKEKSSFSGSGLYNAAASGIKSVDVQKGFDAFNSTPTAISASFVSSQLDALKGGVDAGAVGNFNSLKGSLSSMASSTKALNGVAGRDANGMADVTGAAKLNFDNAVTNLGNAINLDSYKNVVARSAKIAENPAGILAHSFNSSVFGNIADLFMPGGREFVGGALSDMDPEGTAAYFREAQNLSSGKEVNTDFSPTNYGSTDALGSVDKKFGVTDLTSGNAKDLANSAKKMIQWAVPSSSFNAFQNFIP